jgi:hypothetical protein
MPTPRTSFCASGAARPFLGEKAALTIFSGCFAATSSMSMPPSEETISTGRFSSRSMAMPT